MHFKTPEQKKAILLTILLLLIAMGCLLWIYLSGSNFQKNSSNATLETNSIIADIYQDGVLLQSIPLDKVTDSYTFTIAGENGAENEIELRPGSIGIRSASCPDKLCVHQGFISTSLLPITCLPNRLVIQVRVEHADTLNEEYPLSESDILTY